MTRIHRLKIGTKLSVSNTVKKLFGSYPTESIEPKADGTIFIRADLFVAEVQEETPDQAAALFESFGVCSTIEVLIYDVAVREDEDGYEDILGLVNGWLVSTDDDMAFIFEGGMLIFLRKSGELLVNDNQNLWGPEYLELFAVPYKLVPMKPF